MAVRIENHAEPIPGYRLIERLGGGGFGEVWKAEAPGGLHKAIKFVFGDLSSAGDGGGLGFQTLIYSSQAKYPALFATAAVTCALGFIFVAAVLVLSRAALHSWHDSYDRPDQ